MFALAYKSKTWGIIIVDLQHEDLCKSLDKLILLISLSFLYFLISCIVHVTQSTCIPVSQVRLPVLRDFLFFCAFRPLRLSLALSLSSFALRCRKKRDKNEILDISRCNQALRGTNTDKTSGARVSRSHRFVVIWKTSSQRNRRTSTDDIIYALCFHLHNRERECLFLLPQLLL